MKGASCAYLGALLCEVGGCCPIGRVGGREPQFEGLGTWCVALNLVVSNPL